MNIKPTPFTTQCCALIRNLLPTDNAKLLDAINALSFELDLLPTDCISLIHRTSNPDLKPTFDGVHTEETWYNNNIQMPRLLVAITNHLGIENSIPATYRIEPTAIDTLEQARFFLHAYIKREKALCA